MQLPDFCFLKHLYVHIGPPHDLQVREVRSDSLVLLWKPPVYQGRDPVNGFYVDIKEGDAPEEAWRGVNTKAVEKTYLKVFTRSQLAAFYSNKALRLLSYLGALTFAG